jgi:hypothetical protein
MRAGKIAHLCLKRMAVRKEEPRAIFRSEFLSWLTELAAHCAVSLTITHALLAKLFLMKASLPQFCAASALIVEAVMAVARPYSDASGSNLDVL